MENKNLETLILRDKLAALRTEIANERTLLAYVRTALALLVVAGTLIKFGGTPMLSVIGAGFFVFGTLCIAVGLWRFRSVSCKIQWLQESHVDRDPGI